MQRLSDSLAQIAHSERADGRVYLAFQTRPWAGPDLEWHFAGAYKALVGELPSATLGRPPE